MGRMILVTVGLILLSPISCCHAQVGGQTKPASSDPVKPTLVIQKGHTSRVQSVALSRDGKWLVTGSEDETAILWETATGREVRTFHGHKDSINSVALSGDGRWLATGSGGTTLLEINEAEDKVTPVILECVCE